MVGKRFGDGRGIYTVRLKPRWVTNVENHEALACLIKAFKVSEYAHHKLYKTRLTKCFTNQTNYPLLIKGPPFSQPPINMKNDILPSGHFLGPLPPIFLKRGTHTSVKKYSEVLRILIEVTHD